jgi:hypothetical protein
VWLLLVACGVPPEGVSETDDGSTSGGSTSVSVPSSSATASPSSTVPASDTTSVPQSCMAEADCEAPLPYCVDGQCVECTDESHCDGFLCSEGTCLGDPTIAVVVGYGFKRAWSADGIDWQDYQELDNAGMDDDNLLRGVGYGDGTFVAVGGSTNGVTVTSRDGATWENENRGHAGFLSDVVYVGGTFIAAGASGLRIQSADGGVTWDVRGEFLMAHFRAIEVGDGLVVAVGETYGGTEAITSRSEDGVAWIDTMPGGAALRSVAHGADAFVAVGNGGRVSTSADGVAWEDAAVGTADFLEIVWTGAEFLIEANGTLWSSPDGHAWAEVETTQPRPVTAVLRDAYLALSWPATVHRSVDLQAYEDVFAPGGSGLTDIAIGVPSGG